MDSFILSRLLNGRYIQILNKLKNIFEYNRNVKFVD